MNVLFDGEARCCCLREFLSVSNGDMDLRNRRVQTALAWGSDRSEYAIREHGLLSQQPMEEG